MDADDDLAPATLRDPHSAEGLVEASSASSEHAKGAAKEASEQEEESYENLVMKRVAAYVTQSQVCFCVCQVFFSSHFFCISAKIRPVEKKPFFSILFSHLTPQAASCMPYLSEQAASRWPTLFFKQKAGAFFKHPGHIF